MKRILTALFFSLSFVLCSCSSVVSSSKSKPIVLECLVMQPEDHPHSKALISFGKTLEKKTHGGYSLSFTYVDESMAAEDVLLSVQELESAMALLPNTALASCNFEFLLLEHPYFFDSPEQQQAFLGDPEITTALYESILADFVRVLGEFYNGTNHLASDIPLTSASDLEGKSISAFGLLGSIPLFEASGATVTSPGTANVFECSIFDYEKLDLSETLPYLSVTGHSMPPYALIINEEIWASFSDDVIKIFNDNMSKITETAMKEVIKAEETLLSELTKSGYVNENFSTSSFDFALPTIFDLFQHTEISLDLCAAKEAFHKK